MIVSNISEDNAYSLLEGCKVWCKSVKSIFIFQSILSAEDRKAGIKSPFNF